MIIKKDGLHKGMLKSDIDAFLAGKGDYVKIDHLTRFMKEQIPMDIRRYVAILLADIYEKKGMTLDSAKMYEIAAMTSVTFADKVKYYTREALVYIKTGMFERVDDALMKAMGESTNAERGKIQREIVEAYKKIAQEYELKMQRSHAVKIYEKLMSLSYVTEEERTQIKDNLMNLYEKTGNIQKYMTLKRIKEGKNPYS